MGLNIHVSQIVSLSTCILSPKMKLSGGMLSGLDEINRSTRCNVPTTGLLVDQDVLHVDEERYAVADVAQHEAAMLLRDGIAVQGPNIKLGDDKWLNADLGLPRNFQPHALSFDGVKQDDDPRHHEDRDAAVQAECRAEERAQNE